METTWLEKLRRDDIVLIDGGTGTELQRRGVPMDQMVWSGAAVLSHPETVREVHEDYIRAGAEVIISNTFGSTRQMLEPAGYGDDVLHVNRQAVQLACQAREKVAEQAVAVAGSISAMPSGFNRQSYFTPAAELASYREAAEILVDAGADLIALEMLEEPNHAPLALQAALEPGVPVWLGVSCKLRRSDQHLVSFDIEDLELTDTLDVLLPMDPSVVNVMHSEIDAIPAAVELIQERWRGPVGAYPESGYFTKPNWNFVDVIEPADLVREALGWAAKGVRLFGGCCGTGPEHIRALRDALPELLAAR